MVKKLLQLFRGKRVTKQAKRSKRGFTLVELMIVITVIGILATLGIVYFSRVQAQARDAKRKGDVHNIVTALQAYYTENGAYPTQSPAGDAATSINDELETNFMQDVPAAPTGGSATNGNDEYQYISADGSGFALCAALETEPDAAGDIQMWRATDENAAGGKLDDAACAE